MEKLEEHFITSYESHLAKEGKEICKEVDSIMCDNDEFLVKKGDTYSFFISRSKIHEFDPKLVDRCRKYLDEMRNYKHFKHTLEEVNNSRRERERESCLDMRNMRLNGNIKLI